MPAATKYYFEDFPVGETITYGEKLVTADEVIEFALEFDPQPHHLSEEAGKDSVLGGLAASGWHSCCMFMRLMCDAFLLDSASLGAPGLEEIRWRRPVKPGYVLSIRRTCLEARASKSKPNVGLIKFRHVMFNQHGDDLMTVEGWMMMARREAAP